MHAFSSWDTNRSMETPTNAPNAPMIRLYDTNPWRLPESPRPLTLEALTYKVTHTPVNYCTCCEFVSRASCRLGTFFYLL